MELQTDSDTGNCLMVNSNNLISASKNPDLKLSNRERRRLAKQQYQKQFKVERRAKERQRRKLKRKLAQETGVIVHGPSRKFYKQNQMCNSSCKLRVAVDCSFDECMGTKDIMKLEKQLIHCYSANRRAKNPLQFYMCSVHGKLKTRLESIGDYCRWDVNKLENSYLETFAHDDLVYLTGDSPNILMEISDDKVYIIGGLVDHNHYKGICYERAVSAGVQHAKLPLAEHISLKCRSILTVNHVFEILLKFTENRDWKTALRMVVPQRKVMDDTSEMMSSTKNLTCESTQQDDVPVATSHNRENIALIPAATD